MLYFNSGVSALLSWAQVLRRWCPFSLFPSHFLNKLNLREFFHIFQKAIIRSVVLMNSLESISEEGRGPPEAASSGPALWWVCP